MSDPATQRDLGRHDAEIEALKDAVEEVKRTQQKQGEDIQKILAILSQAQGGWKVMVAIAGVAAAVGATATKVMAYLWGYPIPK